MVSKNTIESINSKELYQYFLVVAILSFSYLNTWGGNLPISPDTDLNELRIT